MTQSKDNDSYEITLTSGETIDLSGIIDTTGDITIDLGDVNMGTTTTYWAGDSITDITLNSTEGGTFTLSGGDTIDIGGYTTDWIYNHNQIDPDKVERMCRQYPSLEKVWRNFKSVYDMVQQDYEGKKKAGEIDDELPF